MLLCAWRAAACTKRCTWCRCSCTASRGLLPVMRGTALALAFLIACGPTGKKGGGGDNGGDDVGTTDAGETYFDSGFMDPDATCGAQMSQIGVVNLGDPPDL